MLHARRITALATVSALAVAIPMVAAAPASAAAVKPVTLYGVVGPGYVITLKNAKGAKVTTLKAGKSYVVVVSDKGTAHNFRLKGPGYNHATTVAGKGTFRWALKPRAGSWRFQCDPHKSQMFGTFTVR